MEYEVTAGTAPQPVIIKAAVEDPYRIVRNKVKDDEGRSVTTAEGMCDIDYLVPDDS